MRKNAILACLLALMLAVTTGCSLVEKDAAVDKATEIVKITMPAGTEVLTKGEVQDEVNYQLSYMSYLYSMYGYSYDATDAQNISDAQDSVVQSWTEDTVKTLTARELGFDQMTAEEQADIDATVDSTWEGYKSSVQSSYFADTELTGDELDAAVTEQMTALGYSKDALVTSTTNTKAQEKLQASITEPVTLTEEEITTGYDAKVSEATESYASDPAAYGTAVNAGNTVYYRPEGYRLVKHVLLKFTAEDQAIIDELTSAISNKNTDITTLTATVNSALGDGANVTAAEAAAQVTVSMATAAPVATAEPAPTATPADVATGTDLATPSDIPATAEPTPAVTDIPVSVIATVTDLTAAFTDEVSEDARDAAQQLAQAQAELAFLQEQLVNAKENGWNHLDAKAQEILAAVAAGNDFDELIKTYGEDTGMAEDSNAMKNGGYAVCASTSNMDADFLAASLALENVGDVSGEVKTQFGIHIIKYTEAVTPGAVDLETVREPLSAELLTAKQNTTWTEQVNAWVAQANVKTDKNALKD